MRYKNYVQEITKVLKEYKAKIDDLEKQFENELEKRSREISDMQGKYTPEYIEQYKKSQAFSIDYKLKMSELRKESTLTIEKYINVLEKQINTFFNAPVSQEFSNKINSIAITGLALSNLEFKILQESASTYMERRLLNQLAETRNETMQAVEVNSDTGTPNFVNKRVAKPYLYLQLPDIEEVYGAFDDYKKNAIRVLNGYSGEKAGLYKMLESGIAQNISITSDSYFRNKAEEKILDILEKVNSMFIETKKKQELTDADKKFIDAIIDPKYPSLAKETVQEIAEYDSSIRELLKLDSRYSKYLKED